VAFTVLLIVLIPMSYLFTTSVIQAGQAKNQQTALSIAEKWVEIGSNVTPPVNCNGEAVVDQAVPPTGPNAASTTVSAASNNQNLAVQTTVNVASTTGFASPTGTALVATTTGLQTVAYTGVTGTSLTVPLNSGTGTMTTGCPVTQATTSETRGNTTYSLKAEYEWTTAQNAGVGATTITAASNGQALPQATINVLSTSTLSGASGTNPQTVVIATSAGAQTVTYTGTTSTTLTGVTGGTGTMTTGGAVTQNTQPDLCTSGTPQLLRMRMFVGWGPSSDVNNIQDSVILNYPPNGIQTLGFVALQFSGDTTALDSQGDPWSTRVQAPPVTLTPSIPGQLQALTIYPDSYGCAFAQVLPTGAGTGTYTVSVANASSGIPAGTSYGTPSFVANGGTSTVTANVMQQPQTESQSGVTVNIGAVTRLASTYPSAYPAYDQGSMVNLSYPSSTAVEDGVSCPGVGQITCIARGESSAGAVLTWSNLSTWSSSALPTPTTRIASVACAGTVECEGVGYNQVGGVSTAVILDANPAAPSVATAATGTALTGVTALSQIVCPSATNCVAVGTTGAAAVVLTDTISALGVDYWQAATLPPNITGLTSLVCPPSGSGCVAIGTTSTPSAGSPVAISGGFGSIGVPAVWSTDTAPGVTVTSLSSLACPTSSNCVATGVGKVGASPSGPVVLSGTAPTGFGSSAVAFTPDSFPPGTTVLALTGLNCPSSLVCLVTGAGTKGAGLVPLVMYAAPTAGATFKNDTLPTVSGNPVTSLTQLACPSGSVCVLIGATASAPAILSGAITAPTTADTWTSAAVPGVGGGNSLSQLTQLMCWSSTSCAATGVGTTGTSPSAFLFYSSPDTTTWAQAALPSSNQALHLDGVDCTTSGSPVYCSAVGASATGAVELTSSNGPGGAWNDKTPAGLSGNPASGIPVEINNTNLKPATYATAVTPGAVPNITQLPDLYPFNNGYGLFAGDCAAELGAGSFNLSQAATVPGGTSSVTVPLGVISVQAVHSVGASIGLPYAGATFSLVSTAGGSCGNDSYTLQKAGPDGLSRTEVPYGTYTLTVTGVGTASEPVTVGGSSVVANGSTIQFPSPIPVSVS